MHLVASNAKTFLISSTAIRMNSFAFSAAELAAAERAVVSAHGYAVNVLWNGADPTASHGIEIPAGQCIEVYGNRNINYLRLIRVSSDANVTILLEQPAPSV